MTTQDQQVLEHRLAQAELETIQLRRQVERLTVQVQHLVQAQASTPKAEPTSRVTSSSERITIHEKVTHNYAANLAQPRRVIDYRATNQTTGRTVTIKNYSAVQITRACRKFAKLETLTRRLWHGDRFLYGYALKLFAERGAIVRHHDGRSWSWVAWPHQRHEIAAQIIATLTRPT